MNAPACFCILVGVATAQNITVGASGTLTLGWQGSGPAQQQSQPVNGTTTFQLSGIGIVSLATGVTTTLTVNAYSPPWPGPTMGWWSQAVGDVLVTYAASTPVAGVLRLQLTPACVMVMPPSVDVENDGRQEVPPTGLPTTIDVAVVLGPRPVSVRIQDQVVNFGATCVSTASITFLPTPTNLTSAGVACGSSLSASLFRPVAQTGYLTLHVDDLPTPTSAFAALAFGSTPVAMGPQCGPGLVADGWVYLVPTAGGFDLPIPLVPALVGSVELQYVALELPFQLHWSNRIGLSLP